MEWGGRKARSSVPESRDLAAENTGEPQLLRLPIRLTWRRCCEVVEPEQEKKQDKKQENKKEKKQK